MSKKIAFSITGILIISLVVLIFLHQQSKRDGKQENFVNEYASICGSYKSQNSCTSNSECTWAMNSGKPTPNAKNTVTNYFCTTKSNSS